MPLWERPERATAQIRHCTHTGYDGLGRLDTVAHYAPPDPLMGSIPNRPDEGLRIANFDYELRADGRRIGLTESIFGGPPDTAIPAEENTYEWTYDALGRLIDEVFSTNVDDLLGAGAIPQGTRPLDDYTDHLIYDPAGNRLQKMTDRDIRTPINPVL